MNVARRTAHTSPHSTSRRTARAGLPIRIALGVLAVIAVIIAALAAVNLAAESTYNQATQSLVSNIKAAGEDSADLDALSVLQEQTDAQFEQASSVSAVLLPRIREAISSNAATSARLTKLIAQRLREQRSGGSDKQETSRQPSDEGDDGDSTGGLNEQQRQQVEDLLKSNEQSTPAETEQGGQSSESTTTNNSGNSSKPW